MNTSFEFRPPRGAGIVFNLGGIVLLASGAIWGLWGASQAENNLVFILYLIPVLVAVLGVPFLTYRVLALRGAFYRLERDGVTLRWGLRSEDIPIDAVLWVRPAAEVGSGLPLPLLRWPGNVVGTRRLSGGGVVEFMAANTRQLVLIATSRLIFAVSPENPAEFISIYHRQTELGSLTPLTPRTVYPTFLLGRVWQRRSARALLLTSLVLNLILVTWVALVAPVRGEVIMGVQRGGEVVPAVQLMLLPVLSSFFFLVDFFLGLFFYRRGVLLLATSTRVGSARNPNMVLAYLLWGSAVITSLMFFSAVAYILLS